ncbi:hypothetical protein [Lacinutrix mariniflava]|uniref:hypothetical protein n=1 Tax=Lacinutrix mariniflava TaxID=342955 RepID=UPI0006E1813F|nr:hypothetical protein [Lacinutrix mariniflava]
MKKKKGRQQKKYRKRLNPTQKIVLTILSVFAIAAIFAVIFQNPEIILFTFFLGFPIAFALVGIYILRSRISFIKKADTFLDTFMSSNHDNIIAPNQQFYLNPMYYHLFLILLALLNILFSELGMEKYNDSLYNRFYDDVSFQITIAFLFAIIGFFNPYLKIPLRVKDAIRKRYKKLDNFLSNDRKIYTFRILACIIVVLFFIYKEWLIFPNLFQDNLISKGIDITLLFFVFNSIIQMIRNAKQFLLSNIFRVIKLFTILTSSLFVLVPLVPLTLISLHLLDIDERNINLLPFPFIGFNIIMVYVEYTLNKTNKESKTITETK